jgi:drug/metabolite transporter (DMT)-like permease
MTYLLLVSFIWAFSFGITKHNLSGLDPMGVAWVRLGLGLLLFAFFIRRRHWQNAHAWRWLLLGGVQYGGMYVLVNHAYAYLAAYQVVLFTTFTPLYIGCLGDVLQRRLHWQRWAASGLAFAGAAALFPIQAWKMGSSQLVGFLLVQAADLCFALGQVLYKRWRPMYAAHTDDKALQGLLLAGATLCVTVAMASTQGLGSWGGFWASLSYPHLAALGYLGLCATGLCFFWWNKGVSRTPLGVLAVMNNLKLPLGVAVSLLVFGEQAHLGRLALTMGLMATALVWAYRVEARLPQPAAASPHPVQPTTPCTPQVSTQGSTQQEVRS